jgi:hypothetical protein
VLLNFGVEVADYFHLMGEVSCFNGVEFVPSERIGVLFDKDKIGLFCLLLLGGRNAWSWVSLLLQPGWNRCKFGGADRLDTFISVRLLVYFIARAGIIQSNLTILFGFPQSCPGLFAVLLVLEHN